MKKLLLACSILTVLFQPAQAQRSLGIATGNWSGMSALYLNPANIADNRDKLVIDILGFNAGIDNSLGKIKSIPDVNKFIKDDNANVNDVFTYSNKSQFSLLAPYGEVRGPGVIASINRKHSVAFTTRLRGANQFNHFNQMLYRTILDTSYASKSDVHLQAQNFNWTAHSWFELAFSYGGVMFENSKHVIKAGITARYLGGIGYISLKGDNLDANYIKGQDSFYASKTDIHYASNILTAQNAIGVSNSNFFSQFLGKKQGNGFGADIGVVYDYLDPTINNSYEMDGEKGIPDPTQNRYKFRFSASVMDLGNIYYNTTNNYGLSVTGEGYLTGRGLSDSVKNFSEFQKYAKSHGFNADTGRITSRLYMPANLILSADYHICKKFYANATFIANLADRNNFGTSWYNQFTVTPRYDSRIFSAGLPITYNTLTSSMKLGAGVRYKGFYMGSDDMMVYFTKNQYGINFYAGGFIAISKHRPKDKDGDHVSDKNDRCPDEYGEWSNNGCPVKDKDSE